MIDRKNDIDRKIDRHDSGRRKSDMTLTLDMNAVSVECQSLHTSLNSHTAS